MNAGLCTNSPDAPMLARLLLLFALPVSLSSCRATDPQSASAREPPATTILQARAFPGASLADRISAAISALPSAGGIVDASDFGGLERVARTIVVGSATQPVELRLGNTTFVGIAIPFHLRGQSKLVGNGRTLITQDSAANLPSLISAQDVDRCEMTGVIVDGNRSGNTAAGTGISLTGARSCRLHHLVVRNTVGRFHPGIAFFGPDNRDNTIDHTSIEDIGTLQDYADGIYVSGSGNLVTHNRIRGATDFAIVAEICSACVVSDNIIEASAAGIAVGSGISGYQAAANVVEGNTISGGNTTTWGVITIYRTNGASPVSTIVRGNVIRDVALGHGIFVNGATQVSLDGNLLRNIGAEHASYGIYIKDSEDVTLHDGGIDQTGSFGIGIGNSGSIRIDGVMVTDAGRSGNGAAGIGLDVSAARSSSVSITRVTVFDRNPRPDDKRMPWCIDFGQGGTTDGVLLADILFDDGVNAVGCRDGNVNFQGATRVTSREE